MRRAKAENECKFKQHHNINPSNTTITSTPAATPYHQPQQHHHNLNPSTTHDPLSTTRQLENHSPSQSNTFLFPQSTGGMIYEPLTAGVGGVGYETSGRRKKKLLKKRHTKKCHIVSPAPFLPPRRSLSAIPLTCLSFLSFATLLPATFLILFHPPLPPF
ncbi:hypothetical protein Pcinc_029401 [Petrolisthes cinctipes]|uniref:Uncharacterized protein n=1 Tax=Petrolisthes cinctipes TaxID=88211 RepID=A0AAE1F0X9_PETCI|nr:hypothetical protein Pcinc_029401 [Petrolisthes cinctipes]